MSQDPRVVRADSAPTPFQRVAIGTMMELFIIEILVSVAQMSYFVVSAVMLRRREAAGVLRGRPIEPDMPKAA